MKRILVVLALGACGSKTQEAAPPPAVTAHGGLGEHAEMANLPPELAKFHDVLAPRWHADHGPQRMKDTCAALGEFATGADALAKSQPPAGADATAWGASGKQLVDAVASMKTTCDGNDAAAFEPAFAGVHNGFHALLEASASEHKM